MAPVMTPAGGYLPGDLILVNTQAWSSRIIRDMTQSPINHTAGIWDFDGKTFEMHQGKSTVGHPRGLHVRIPDMTNAVREECQRLGPVLLNRNYNNPGLVALALSQRGGEWLPFVHSVLTDDNNLFCSQAVDWWLTRAGYQVFDDGRPPGLVSPGDLLLAALWRGWPITPLGGGIPPSIGSWRKHALAA